MMLPRDEVEIEAPWIAAMIVLAIALIVGVVLYFRMSAPLHEPTRRDTKSSVVPVRSPEHVYTAGADRTYLAHEPHPAVRGKC